MLRLSFTIYCGYSMFSLCIMVENIRPVSCHLFATVRVPMLLSIMPFPVLRSMMSKIISKSEQGERV